MSMNNFCKRLPLVAFICETVNMSYDIRDQLSHLSSALTIHCNITTAFICSCLSTYEINSCDTILTLQSIFHTTKSSLNCIYRMSRSWAALLAPIFEMIIAIYVSTFVVVVAGVISMKWMPPLGREYSVDCT